MSFKMVMLWGPCSKRTPRIFSSRLASMSRQAKTTTTKKQQKTPQHLTQSIQGLDVSKVADSTTGTQPLGLCLGARGWRPAWQRRGRIRPSCFRMSPPLAERPAPPTQSFCSSGRRHGREGPASSRDSAASLLGDLTLPALGKVLF